jgi:hypothetical protein
MQAKKSVFSLKTRGRVEMSLAAIGSIHMPTWLRVSYLNPDDVGFMRRGMREQTGWKEPGKGPLKRAKILSYLLYILAKYI